jgi:hypothetical protein
VRLQLRVLCTGCALTGKQYAGKWPLSFLAADASGAASIPHALSASAMRKVCAATGRATLLGAMTRGMAQITFEGTMDLVRQLCEASANLIKVFPLEDRPVRCARALPVAPL